MSSLSYLATSILSHVVCSVHLQKTLGKFGKGKGNKTRQFGEAPKVFTTCATFWSSFYYIYTSYNSNFKCVRNLLATSLHQVVATPSSPIPSLNNNSFATLEISNLLKLIPRPPLSLALHCQPIMQTVMPVCTASYMMAGYRHVHHVF